MSARFEHWTAWRPWVSTVARLGLAAVFAIASLAKITETDGMVRAVRAYQILPEGAVRPVAYALPPPRKRRARLLSEFNISYS